MICLTSLVPHMVPGGVIIVDDYHTWDGCSKAVHDFLSQRQSAMRVKQFDNGIAYLVVR
jgi:O-methyltransferase